LVGDYETCAASLTKDRGDPTPPTRRKSESVRTEGYVGSGGCRTIPLGGEDENDDENEYE
jgi:hypothetical protein